MTTAFFGLLRASEYTCKRVSAYDPETDLCINDVTCETKLAFLHLKSSKTDIFRVGTVIRLVANDSVLCPVAALRQYLRLRPHRPGPLFQFFNGHYLRRTDVSRLMKGHTGLTANLSSHSFRIGGASTLANLGYPRWLIQSLGRWSSDCFRVYLRLTDHTIMGVSRAMAYQPSNTATYEPDLA
jgi:hypothetical protein